MTRKLLIKSLVFLLLSSCLKTNPTAINKMKTVAFYVGTYTDGESQGIYKYDLAENGTLHKTGLVAKCENPSYLTKSANGKFLIVVNEVNNANGAGTLASYLIKKDSLIFLSESASGGAHPCYVSTNDQGYVLAANYTGGSIGLMQIDSTGQLSPLLDLQQHRGKSSHQRQDAPHAHSAFFSPDKTEVIAVDLGTNQLWFYKIDTQLNKLLATPQKNLDMPASAGPRHLVFHPNNNWIYVLNELNNSISLVKKDKDRTYSLDQSISTLPPNYQGENTGADIHISSDGNFLYTSNRGHNSIAIFKVNKVEGTLTLIGHEATRGESPRNFSLSPNEEYLLVANQNTNNIISFKRNKESGLLTFVDEITAPKPVCILF